MKEMNAELLNVKRLNSKRLMAAGAVIRNDVAYVLVKGRFRWLVREFTRAGNRWVFTGEGHAELPYYAGMFPEVAYPACHCHPKGYTCS